MQFALPCWQLLSKHISVKGVFIFSTKEFEEVMQWMSEGKSYSTCFKALWCIPVLTVYARKACWLREDGYESNFDE